MAFSIADLEASGIPVNELAIIVLRVVDAFNFINKHSKLRDIRVVVNPGQTVVKQVFKETRYMFDMVMETHNLRV